jgi:hypothetical protein
LSGRNKPNRVSWTLWAVAPLVGVYISYKSGISFPLLLSTFMSGFGPLLVVIASFFNKKSYWKITSFDIVCGFISVIAIIIFVITKNAILSLAFAIIADLFAGIPTIVKAWRHSDTETASAYIYGIMNTIITFLIIKDFSFLNYGFPLYIFIANTIIIVGIKKNLFKSPLADNTFRNK